MPPAVTRDIRTILSLDVPLVVVVAERTMTLGEVLCLRPGYIIELNKPAEDTLGVRINTRPIGTGNAVKVGENFGVRIASVGTKADRVQAMGTPQGG